MATYGQGYDPRFRTARDPRQAIGIGAVSAPLPASAAVAALAPQTVQFPLREQLLNPTAYGAVARLSGEDKTGLLGGSPRRRGAARAILG